MSPIHVTAISGLSWRGMAAWHISDSWLVHDRWLDSPINHTPNSGLSLCGIFWLVHVSSPHKTLTMCEKLPYLIGPRVPTWNQSSIHVTAISGLSWRGTAMWHISDSWLVHDRWRDSVCWLDSPINHTLISGLNLCGVFWLVHDRWRDSVCWLDSPINHTPISGLSLFGVFWLVHVSPPHETLTLWPENGIHR